MWNATRSVARDGPRHTTAEADAGQDRRGVGALRAILTLAVDWPGWCCSDREEKAALQALIDYGPRYAQVLQASGAQLQVPTDIADLVVVERHEGNLTTDFGALAIVLGADRGAMDGIEYERWQ